MQTRIKEIGNRLLSGFLAFLMIIALTPVSATAAEPVEVTDENGFVDLKVYPMMGGYGKQYAKEPHSVSFFTNIMLWEDNSLDVPRSCYGFYVTAEYKAGSSSADKTVSLIAQEANEPKLKDAGEVRNSVKSESGKAELMIALDMAKTENEKFIWYFVAGGGGHSTKLSVEVNRLHSARATAKLTYSRVGIQVRVIDNHPLGIGNYMDNQSNFAPNSGPDAMLTNPTGTYTGMDGITYDNSYFDLILERSPDTTNHVVTVENLDEFYEWLNRYYIPEANRRGIRLDDTITLAGPAYVRCKDTNSPPINDPAVKCYNVAYYARNEGRQNSVDRNKAGTITKASVNDFTWIGEQSWWGENTKLDFVRLAYCKLIIPTVRTGKVRVEYYNEANPTQQIKASDTIDTDSFRMTSNYADLRTNILNKVSNEVLGKFFTNNGTAEPLAMVKDNTIASKFTEFKTSATSLVFDSTQNKLTLKQDADASQELKTLRKYVDVRNSVARQFKEGKVESGVNLTAAELKTSDGKIKLENVKNYLGIYDIVPPAIPGYTFDFGIGTDALAKQGYGAVVMLADDPSVSVIVDQQTAEAVVKLYYRGNTGYTVKVSINGVIDETLTRQYPAAVGTVIRREDVNTSVVPPDVTIKNITNVPLTVNNDPTKNIITIECIKGTGYTVKVSVNGVIDETLTRQYPAAVGTVIRREDVNTSVVPPDVTIKNITNVPLTVNNDPTKNIITIECIKGTGYTVKVKIDGYIDETLTRDYPATVGDVIKDEDVDTSVVPPGVTVKDIINVPLTVDPDPTKNIITIDASTPAEKFTVFYYLDKVLKEKAEYKANIGDTISSPPMKSYPGYSLDYVDGTPLTVTNSIGVIHVYYKKDAPAPAPNMNANLYKDEYRTEVKMYKSGYGVWGKFVVDVSEYVNATKRPTWEVNGGCHAAGRNKTVGRYTDINVTATATFYDGMDSAGKLIKGNGKKVTVTMVKNTAESTPTKWVFNFPVHAGSNKRYPKAYIPIDWKDAKQWTVEFNAVVTCQEYMWDNGTEQTRCSGHRWRYVWYDEEGKKHVDRGVDYCYYDINTLNEWYEGREFKRRGSASIMINGNMYEDDFTGDRH